MECNKEYILRLLELYFEAQTTLRQEAELKELLAAIPETETDERLAAARLMFGGFRKLSVASGNRLRDTGNSDLSDTGHTIRQSDGSMKIKWLRMVSVAALLCVVVGIGFMLNDSSQAIADDEVTIYGYLNGSPVTDPDVAIRQVRMAKRILASSIRVSEESINTLKETDSGEKLQKVLDNLIRDSLLINIGLRQEILQ